MFHKILPAKNLPFSSSSNTWRFLCSSSLVFSTSPGFLSNALNCPTTCNVQFIFSWGTRNSVSDNNYYIFWETHTQMDICRYFYTKGSIYDSLENVCQINVILTDFYLIRLDYISGIIFCQKVKFFRGYYFVAVRLLKLAEFEKKNPLMHWSNS